MSAELNYKTQRIDHLGIVAGVCQEISLFAQIDQRVKAKDPLFFANTLFLKKPERIMALLMIMGLALLIYALAERKLRQALKEIQATLPNQLGKPTQTPTMRWVFQLFEGLDILLICQNGPNRLPKIGEPAPRPATRDLFTQLKGAKMLFVGCLRCETWVYS